MRIVQIIDSLEAGGAERIAVNYANGLVAKASFSALVATRKEGSLKQQINPQVAYLFLNRKNVLDFRAVFRLRKFCSMHKIQYLQAHSSSFFIAFLVKLALPKIKIIWHDHDGMSEFLEERKITVLKPVSYFFSGIISVNHRLKDWAESRLHCREVIYLPNFTQSDYAGKATTVLLGNEGKRILCLANLRPQKNHFLLIEIARKIKFTHPDWSFHLVGKDFKDNYSLLIKKAVKENDLGENVFLYGSKDDIANIISQSQIAVLTSESEGLPVSLLEYGINKKPVVVTNVGEMPAIIKTAKNGFIVRGIAEDFQAALIKLIDDEALRQNLGSNLYNDILKDYSQQAVLEKFTNWIQKI